MPTKKNPALLTISIVIVILVGILIYSSLSSPVDPTNLSDSELLLKTNTQLEELQSCNVASECVIRNTLLDSCGCGYPMLIFNYNAVSTWAQKNNISISPCNALCTYINGWTPQEISTKKQCVNNKCTISDSK